MRVMGPWNPENLTDTFHLKEFSEAYVVQEMAIALESRGQSANWSWHTRFGLIENSTVQLETKM